MRKLSYALIAFSLFVQFSCGPSHVVVESPPPPPPPPAQEVSYQNFYDALSPYGEWINNPDYGYVWMPNVGPDFKPYATNGNWVYTDEGWMWASNYSWGWAPFHYGRWFYEEGYGWMWMPGNEWGPAWVSWRTSPDYYGWAPLGPSVTITAAAGGGYNPPPHYWCFVPHQYVTSPRVTNYYVSEQQNVTIINNTTIIRNTTIVNNTYNNTTVVNNTRVTVNNYAGGPDPGEVARFTGAPLRPVAVHESNTPGANGSGGAFAIYRPRINAAPQGGGNGASSFKPAPVRVQALANVRPVNTTIYNNNRNTVNNTTVNNTTVNKTTVNNNITTNNNNNTTANRPASSQTTAQPAGQPAGTGSGTLHNGSSGNGTPGNESTAGSSATMTPAAPKPAANQYQSQTANHPTTVGSSNVNPHPGQLGTNANPPKPPAQQGQKPKSKQKKANPKNQNNNPDNKP